MFGNRWVTDGISVRVVLLLALLLATTGCRLDLDTTVTLDADGGGTLGVTVSADADILAQATRLGVDPLQRMVTQLEAADTRWRASVRDTNQGGQVATITTDFSDPADFDVAWEELRADLAAPEATLLGPMTLALDEEEGAFTLTGAVPLELAEAVATSPEASTGSVGDVFGSTLVFQAPGSVLEGGVNADAEPLTEDPDGPVQLVWTAVPGQVVDVDVTVEQPQSGLLDLLIPVGIGALAVLLISGGVLAQRRR